MGTGVEGRGAEPGRRCDACGAAVIVGTHGYCSYCGAELPLPRAEAVGETAARFAALEVHPRTKELRERGLAPRGSHRPRAVRASGLAAMGMLLVVMLGLGLLGILGLLGLGKALEAWGWLGLAAAAVGIAGTGAAAVLVVALPVESPGLRSEESRSWLPVRILDLQVDETHSGKSRRLVHEVLVEERSGDRRRLRTPSAALRERLAPDDMGLAHVEAGELVAFERVDV